MTATASTRTAAMTTGLRLEVSLFPVSSTVALLPPLTVQPLTVGPALTVSSLARLVPDASLLSLCHAHMTMRT